MTHDTPALHAIRKQSIPTKASKTLALYVMLFKKLRWSESFLCEVLQLSVKHTIPSHGALWCHNATTPNWSSQRGKKLNQMPLLPKKEPSWHAGITDKDIDGLVFTVLGY